MSGFRLADLALNIHCFSIDHTLFCMHICVDCSIDVQDRDLKQTLLHLAVIQGKTEYVRILRHKFNTGELLKPKSGALIILSIMPVNAAYSSRRDSLGRLPIHYLSGQPDVRDLVDLLGEATRLSLY